MDYESLRNFVLNVIEEHEGKGEMALVPVGELKTGPSQKQEKNQADQIEFDESAIQDILLSVEAFRGWVDGQKSD